MTKGRDERQRRVTIPISSIFGRDALIFRDGSTDRYEHRDVRGPRKKAKKKECYLILERKPKKGMLSDPLGVVALHTGRDRQIRQLQIDRGIRSVKALLYYSIPSFSQE